MKWGEEISRMSTRVIRRTVPIIVALVIAYLFAVYCYYISWREVYHNHSKATGIGLIIGEVTLVCLIVFIWIQVIALGPGFQPHVPLFKLVRNDGHYQSISPPQYFMSDKNGYPIWCSHCQSIKIDRSHHSSEFKRCIGRFDHYCTFIGALIGKRNYRLFMQFVFWFLMYFLYVGISAAIYAKDIKERNGGLNANIIILFISCVFCVIMLTALFTSHIYYIYVNITSIHDIVTKRHRRQRTPYDQYVNFKYGKKRFVLRINPEKDFIWSKGFCKNWVEIMGSNPLFWIIPWGTPVQNYGDIEGATYEEIVGDFREEVSAEVLQKWEEDVKKGNFVTLSESV